MNWKKINKWWNYFIFFICGLGIIMVMAATIVGGVQSGDLTLVGFPLWIWANIDTVYFFLGCFTAGGIVQSLWESTSKKDKEKDKTEKDKENESFGALLLIIISGFLWPLVWSVVFFDWFWSFIKKETKDDRD